MKLNGLLTKKGIYTTKSMYKFMSFGGIVNVQLNELWKVKMPLKIKIFLRQLLQDKIQSRDQPKKGMAQGTGIACYVENLRMQITLCSSAQLLSSFGQV